LPELLADSVNHRRERDRLRGRGIGSDVMKPIAAPIVGGMITSTIQVLILVPVFFAIMKERALKNPKLS
jgi:Cu/Ag efflux pump CusA